MSLHLRNIHTQLIANGDKILNGVDLEINPGEVHVLMGPNGSGKSTLAKAIMDHPDYEMTKGKIIVDGDDVTESTSAERAQRGIFLASQYPTEVPGVNLVNFLRLAFNSVKPEKEHLSIYKFRQLFREKLTEVGLDESFMNRNLNEGFSGGEKKKCEILQMLILEPKYTILDETDSGLDVDAIRTVFSTLSTIIKESKTGDKKMGTLIITHYAKVFEYIEPNFVHIFKDGRIVETGGMEIAKRIDKEGYLK